jgi:hypothetical protein
LPKMAPRSCSNSSSSDDSDENAPVLSIESSRADLLKVSMEFKVLCINWSYDNVSEIARQFEVDKNTAQAELKRLGRKLGDITNDDENHGSGNQSKRLKTHNKSPSSGSDESEDMETINRADEHFVFQAGHKFFLLYGPWIHSGGGLFETSIDKHYLMAERFENDDNRSQGQLKEILDLLKVKFGPQALCQRWLQRQVSYIHIWNNILTWD